jgi:poly(3-hydroxyalkanoate) synthetase
MGIYDDKANIKMVKARTGVDKVNFIGYSSGSQQILYALAEIEDEIADDLYSVATMAPCTLSEDYVDPSVYTDGVFKF